MKKNVAKTTRISHPDESRAEALRLADQLGAADARQLDLHPSQLSQWRSKAQHQASGSSELDTPRDHSGTFDPQFIEKNQTHLTYDLERKIITL